MSEKIKYRYKCRTCKTQGRWVLNPNTAAAQGEMHYLKHTSGHEVDLVDSSGKNHGPAH